MEFKNTAEQGGSTASQCCATAQSTGKRCKLPVLRGQNFCGIHAGKYHPGQKKGAQPRLKHGIYSAEAYQDRREAREAIRAVHKVIEEIENVVFHPEL